MQDLCVSRKNAHYSRDRNVYKSSSYLPTNQLSDLQSTSRHHTRLVDQSASRSRPDNPR